jgi:hypothetical protein
MSLFPIFTPAEESHLGQQPQFSNQKLSHLQQEFDGRIYCSETQNKRVTLQVLEKKGPGHYNFPLQLHLLQTGYQQTALQK